MMNKRYGMAMAETLHYLKGIRQEDIDKIPNKLMDFIKANASKNYECNFDYNKPLKDLELMNETRGLISLICLKYWCETEEQKNSFKNHLSANEIRYQEELSKKYNIDNIFKENTENTTKSTNKLPSFEKKENIIKKFLKNFFNIS